MLSCETSAWPGHLAPLLRKGGRCPPPAARPREAALSCVCRAPCGPGTPDAPESPRSAAPPSHVQAWFRADWKRDGGRADLCPVGSLTAGTFLSLCPVCSRGCGSVCPPACSGPPAARPTLPRAARRCWQLHSPVIVCMWSELALEAGVLSGGRGEGLGSRSGLQGGMPAHLHPCMLRILLPQRGARRGDLPPPRTCRAACVF